MQSPSPITFEPVLAEELPDFILRVQESFSVAVREKFGTDIHFYLNKCGFRIVEFYNKYHPAPEMPEGEDEDPDDDCGFFRFKKLMAPQH